MGADIVIGSYTGGKLLKEMKLNSITGIMEQIGFYSGYYDSKEEMKLLDLLIEPNLNEFSIASFKDADTIIARGYRAALPFKKYFKKLADSLNMIGPQDELENILGKRTYSFDKIDIIGNEIISDDQIRGILGIMPGDNVNNDLLRERIELLYGKIWFEKVKYSMKHCNDSLILVIDCFEKPRIMLNGSLHYDDAINAGLIIDISGENLLTQRSKINLDSYIAEYFRLRMKYMQFIDRNQKYGISADIYFDKNYLPGLHFSGKMNECKIYDSFYNLIIQSRIGLNKMLSISAGIETGLLILQLKNVLLNLSTIHLIILQIHSILNIFPTREVYLSST
jgi:NTE family protein